MPPIFEAKIRKSIENCLHRCVKYEWISLEISEKALSYHSDGSSSLMCVCCLLFSSEHKMVLSLLAAFCLVLIYFLVQRRCSWVSKVALALGLLGVYSYRAAVDNVLFPWQHSGHTMSK